MLRGESWLLAPLEPSVTTTKWPMVMKAYPGPGLRSLKWGFSEFHNNTIHSHLRTENCMEKPAIETQSLILASAQLDHLSCFYDKVRRERIWLEALSKLCAALSAVSFLHSHQTNFSLGWLSPSFRPVLITVAFLFGVAQCFSGTLSSSSEMISRFSSFTFVYLLFSWNRVYIIISQCCTKLSIPSILGINFSCFSFSLVLREWSVL